MPGGAILFPRIGENRFEKKKAEQTNEAKKGGGKPKPAAAASTKVDISRVDLRVGQVIEVERHPSADHLYVEKIDIGEGEGKFRIVCSGLAKYLTLEELQNRRLVVVCNMKPTNFRGVRSEAMVLAGTILQENLSVLFALMRCVSVK